MLARTHIGWTAVLVVGSFACELPDPDDPNEGPREICRYYPDTGPKPRPIRCDGNDDAVSNQAIAYVGGLEVPGAETLAEVEADHQANLIAGDFELRTTEQSCGCRLTAQGHFVPVQSPVQYGTHGFRLWANRFRCDDMDDGECPEGDLLMGRYVGRYSVADEFFAEGRSSSCAEARVLNLAELAGIVFDFNGVVPWCTVRFREWFRCNADCDHDFGRRVRHVSEALEQDLFVDFDHGADQVQRNANGSWTTRWSETAAAASVAALGGIVPADLFPEDHFVSERMTPVARAVVEVCARQHVRGIVNRVRDGDDDNVCNNEISGTSLDNCPEVANSDQSDGDQDMVGDVCDNCPDDYDPEQLNRYGENAAGFPCRLGDPDDPTCADPDNLGDVCGDVDADGISDYGDWCPTIPSPVFDMQHGDRNGNDIGDECDDPDEDGVADSQDNCLDVANADQLDSDGDGFGDVCDLCPRLADGDAQVDADGDGIGDSCDCLESEDLVSGVGDSCTTDSQLAGFKVCVGAISPPQVVAEPEQDTREGGCVVADGGACLCRHLGVADAAGIVGARYAIPAGDARNTDIVPRVPVESDLETFSNAVLSSLVTEDYAFRPVVESTEEGGVVSLEFESPVTGLAFGVERQHDSELRLLYSETYYDQPDPLINAVVGCAPNELCRDEADVAQRNEDFDEIVEGAWDPDGDGVPGVAAPSQVVPPDAQAEVDYTPEVGTGRDEGVVKRTRGVRSFIRSVTESAISEVGLEDVSSLLEALTEWFEADGLARRSFVRGYRFEYLAKNLFCHSATHELAASLSAQYFGDSHVEGTACEPEFRTNAYAESNGIRVPEEGELLTPLNVHISSVRKRKDAWCDVDGDCRVGEFCWQPGGANSQAVCAKRVEYDRQAYRRIDCHCPAIGPGELAPEHEQHAVLGISEEYKRNSAHDKPYRSWYESWLIKQCRNMRLYSALDNLRAFPELGWSIQDSLANANFSPEGGRPTVMYRLRNESVAFGRVFQGSGIPGDPRGQNGQWGCRFENIPAMLRSVGPVEGNPQDSDRGVIHDDLAASELRDGFATSTHRWTLLDPLAYANLLDLPPADCPDGSSQFVSLQPACLDADGVVQPIDGVAPQCPREDQVDALWRICILPDGETYALTAIPLRGLIAGLSDRMKEVVTRVHDLPGISCPARVVSQAGAESDEAIVDAERQLMVSRHFLRQDLLMRDALSEAGMEEGAIQDHLRTQGITIRRSEELAYTRAIESEVVNMATTSGLSVPVEKVTQLARPREWDRENMDDFWLSLPSHEAGYYAQLTLEHFQRIEGAYTYVDQWATPDDVLRYRRGEGTRVDIHILEAQDLCQD